MQRPTWRVLAGGGAAVVAAAAVVVVVTGDDGDDGGGDAGCLSGLIEHLPPEITTVSGTDFDRARAADLTVDGSVEEIGSIVIETNLRVDPLTGQRVQFMEDTTDSVGYGLGDLRCWAGEQGKAFVARGSFDPDAVAGAPAGAGDARASDDLVAYDPVGDPQALIETVPTERPVFDTAIEVLDRHGVVTFDLVDTGVEVDSPWVGMGLAHGDGWELIGVWSFVDPDEAAAERTDVVAAIAEGDVGGMIDGDPGEVVQQDGPALWMRAPLVADTADWTRPVVLFDPVFTVVADFADGN
jgi:hypothetical protein